MCSFKFISTTGLFLFQFKKHPKFWFNGYIFLRPVPLNPDSVRHINVEFSIYFSNNVYFQII